MEYIELDDDSRECAVSPEFLNMVLWLLGPAARDKFLYPAVDSSVRLYNFSSRTDHQERAFAVNGSRNNIFDTEAKESEKTTSKVASLAADGGTRYTNDANGIQDRFNHAGGRD
ncbi:hypothetical protein G9G54_13500 [Paenibacillus sp. EKM212P]|uniref:hypothetical protein n=1 Tax=Paenibacillus sp. EKM212P TaxID=1683680 RepID=UPI0013EB1ECA|nr:hypothetical protein [Paenibacillus sp. EKM212P]KAF6578288.1 hypothetical protein G9G54_13500 [Paenibacillus sp. EKM212P]